MKKKKILVTGGNGFIGSALVRRLVKEGYRVRVFDSNLRGTHARLNDIAGRVEMVQADIRAPWAVRKAARGVDAVYHLAYLNGTEFFYLRPDLVLDIGVKGMVNVIDSCIKEKVEELIVLSSSEVYQTPPAIPTDESVPLSVPDPLNPRYSYGGGKIASELMAINYGRKFFKRSIVIRPHNVYGPDMGWEHVVPQFVIRMKALCGKSKDGSIAFPIQGDGSQTRAFIYIDDFVDGFMLVARKGEHLGIYNIGTNEEIPIKEVVKKAAAYFGRKAVIKTGKTQRLGGTSRRCPDITKIKKMGFSQTVSFGKGFDITAKWYDENSARMPKDNRERIEDAKIYIALA